jgi:hypothetical protein
MTLTEWGLVIALAGETIAVIIALIRLTAWTSEKVTSLTVRLERAERDIANDVLGRKAIAQALTDIAAIKSQVFDMRDEWRQMRELLFKHGQHGDEKQ